jgi:hypothetical protein
VTVNVRLTEVTVCALPEDNFDHDCYALKVQWRGGETYAVVRGTKALGVDGEWDYEPSSFCRIDPSGRTDEWIATHRFGYDEALRRAVEAAPHVTVNGRTVADCLARQVAP